LNKNLPDKKTPEEIAKDLEEIDFAEIDEVDLQAVFGGGASDLAETNCNCGCEINTSCGQ
jgi:natural product precursor